MQKLRLAVLISGRGSNMEALIRACEDPGFPAEIVAVVSNKKDAPGLEKARKAGIRTLTVSGPAFEQEIADSLKPLAIDLVCLAGFMRLLKGPLLEAYPEKIINIHPSLLPAYKGLDVHARVVAAGEKESGCTVHIVVPEMDAGPILIQRRVPVLPDDTPDRLAERILEQEHIAYPQAIRKIANGAKG